MSAPALSVGASAPAVKLGASPPAANVGASVETPGLNIGADLKGAAADLKRGVKNVGAEVGGLFGKAFGAGGSANVSVPKAGVEIRGPKAEVQAPKVELKGQAPKLNVGAAPVVKLGATVAPVNVGATAPGVRVVPAAQAASAGAGVVVALPKAQVAVKPVASGIGADLKGAAAELETVMKKAGGEVSGLFGKTIGTGPDAHNWHSLEATAPNAQVDVSGVAPSVTTKPASASAGAGVQVAGPTFHKPDLSALAAGVRIPGAQVRTITKSKSAHLMLYVAAQHSFTFRSVAQHLADSRSHRSSFRRRYLRLTLRPVEPRHRSVQTASSCPRGPDEYVIVLV